MHRDNLYNICSSKASSLSNLTDSLVLLAKLPTTDDTRKKVAEKCASLIKQSAFEWEQDGLLYRKNYIFGKRVVLRNVWAVYASSFHNAEAAILKDVTEEEPTNQVLSDDDHGSSRKVSYLIFSIHHTLTASDSERPIPIFPKTKPRYLEQVAVLLMEASNMRPRTLNWVRSLGQIERVVIALSWVS